MFNPPNTSLPHESSLARLPATEKRTTNTTSGTDGAPGGNFAALLTTERQALNQVPAVAAATDVRQQTMQSDTAADKQSQNPVATEQVATGETASEKFQAYMNKSDAEKIRESMLQEMGLTEEEFRELPPEEQEAINREIMERLKEQAGMSRTGSNIAATSIVNLIQLT